MIKRYKVNVDFVVDAETETQAENIVLEALKNVMLVWYFTYSHKVQKEPVGNTMSFQE